MKRVICGDSLRVLTKLESKFDLVFFDPPFNQNKDYFEYDDDLPQSDYWEWVTDALRLVFGVAADGCSMYFMQREKNIPAIAFALEATGWTYQNFIIWKKMASSPPGGVYNKKFRKSYQVIGYYSKGKPKVFNRLKIVKPYNPEHKVETPDITVGDIWEGIREMTAGFFSRREQLLDKHGSMFHKQQTPVALLLRILLASSLPGSNILDPFAGTGTSLIVADQLRRGFVGIEKDPVYYRAILNRFRSKRSADNVSKYRELYHPTPNLDRIWR